MNKQILLSGVKPTGRPHLGNYFGALKQFVDLQDKYETFIMIADYHALTTAQNPAELRRDTLEMAIDYLAIGLDPNKVHIFKQSDVAEHTEMAWIFNCITTMPYLMRAHAYKDAAAKNKDINVGLFEYPLLMAADILLYDTEVVPVGQDQKQHVEIARDTAEKFNRIYGETFKLPAPMILKEVETVPGTDGRKMSKSYGNTIPLFASDEEIEKAVMSIVTDSGAEIPKNVYAIHRLFRSQTELDKLYEEKKGKYKELKEALIADIKSFISPLRKRRAEIADDADKIKKILESGAAHAKAIASAKMSDVRKKIGVS
ncbi:MAG: tryptophan--tRNA ligase [Candidatus Vogelbacteria bacterium]|nr:tryptophan--tRNA ligase [Candidatus Vogelbacteria bacterium]